MLARALRFAASSSCSLSPSVARTRRCFAVAASAVSTFSSFRATPRSLFNVSSIHFSDIAKKPGRSTFLKKNIVSTSIPVGISRDFSCSCASSSSSSSSSASSSSADQGQGQGPGPSVEVTINGRKVQVREHATLLEACSKLKIDVPTLCAHPRLPATGVCRMCLVEVDQGSGNPAALRPACVTEVSPGMSIATDTDRVTESVRSNLALLLASHPRTCMACDANGACELQDLIHRFRDNKMDDGHGDAIKFGSLRRGSGRSWDHEWCDDSSAAIARMMSKCIKCGRCVRACHMQGMDVLGTSGRGHDGVPSTTGDAPLDMTRCIECGQCASFCPTGAIVERPHLVQVLHELDSQRKIMVAATAPSVRVALGEEFGMGPGSPQATGQMVAGLREAGFQYVFDTQFTADLTILEEGTELVGRILASLGMAKDGHKTGPLPMFTSCCPGWVNLVEKSFPALIPHLSTARSPQGMMGSIVKRYFAATVLGVNPEDVCLVSIMPCTAKKAEASRPQLALGGPMSPTEAAEAQAELERALDSEDAASSIHPLDAKVAQETDYVLTTRELARLLHIKKIQLGALQSAEFDNPLGDSTGAAHIFGATGGVMEAALRTAYLLVTGKELPPDGLDIHAVRGLQGVKECTLELPLKEELGGGTLPLRLAVTHGTANARHLLRRMQDGEVEYDFVEVMACPGGCIGGGGQPKSKDPLILDKRMAAVYSKDQATPLRKSHENEAVQQFYKDVLSEPNSHLAHEWLHTSYAARDYPAHLHAHHEGVAECFDFHKAGIPQQDD